MGRTLAEMLPLALAASISPSGLLLVMAILGSKVNPKKNSLYFLLGSAFFLVTLGMFILATFNPAAEQTNHPKTASAVVDIAFGLLIILILGRSLFLKKKKKTLKEKKRKRPYVVIGFFYMFVNTSTLIPFIAATKIIADGRLDMWETIPLFAILLFFTMSLVSLPVAVTYVMPQKSEKILGPVKVFMTRHGRLIANVFFFLIAIYLLIHGVREMLA